MKSRIAILLFFPLFLNAVVPAFAFEKGEGMHRELSENPGTKSGTVISCQARQTEVKNRMTHLTQLATDMQNVFDRIATRVENYYTTKLVPSGKTVPNYSSLVTAIATQKTAVTAALTTAQNDANSFTCDGSTTPKAQTEKFRKVITEKSEYEFDYLIIALGSESAYFGIAGLAEHALPLKSVADALRIKTTIHKLYDEKAAKGEKVRVIIGGGGFSGTELAAEMVNYRHRLAREHKLSEELLDLCILQGSDRLLKELDPRVSALSMKRVGTDVVMLFGGHIQSVAQKEITTDQDKKIPYDVLVWTGGVGANGILKTSGCATSKSGQVAVNHFLQISDFPNIFVIGDCAEFIDDVAKKPAPGVAQVAEDEGKIAAENVVRSLQKKQLKPYRYNHFGYIVPLRGHYAVFASKHFYIHGFFGWLIQQIVFLRYLLGILPVTKAFRKWNQFERNLDMD